MRRTLAFLPLRGATAACSNLSLRSARAVLSSVGVIAVASAPRAAWGGGSAARCSSGAGSTAMLDSGAMIGPAPSGEDTRLTSVLEFWFAGDPSIWFTKNPALDKSIADTFQDMMDAAAGGEFEHLLTTPRQALAVIVLLDQFSRNVYRDSPKAFAADGLAQKYVELAIAQDFDAQLPPAQAAMLLMPLMHSEDLRHHDLLMERYGYQPPGSMEHNITFAQSHRATIEEFGRYPHRNKVLGRASTAAENKWVEAGGGW